MKILLKALCSVLLPLVTGFNINPALIVHLLNSLGSILARRHFRSAHMPHQATDNVCILPDTHLYTWVESSNVDKVSCWRTKSARHWRENRNPQPFDPWFKGSIQYTTAPPWYKFRPIGLHIFQQETITTPDTLVVIPWPGLYTLERNQSTERVQGSN